MVELSAALLLPATRFIHAVFVNHMAVQVSSVTQDVALGSFLSGKIETGLAAVGAVSRLRFNSAMLPGEFESRRVHSKALVFPYREWDLTVRLCARSRVFVQLAPQQCSSTDSCVCAFAYFYVAVLRAAVFIYKTRMHKRMCLDQDLCTRTLVLAYLYLLCCDCDVRIRTLLRLRYRIRM